jgi:hypothetical protein
MKFDLPFRTDSPRQDRKAHGEVTRTKLGIKAVQQDLEGERFGDIIVWPVI